MALGKPNEAPFNALIRILKEKADPAVKTAQNIPSGLHGLVGMLAEAMGADELASERKATAQEKRVEGGYDINAEDLMKVVELAALTSPQGALGAAAEVAAPEGSGSMGEMASKAPENLHFSAANIAKALGAEEIARDRTEDGESLKARRLGKDATAQDAMDQRIEEAMGDLGSTAKPAAKPELTLDEIEARDMAASAKAMPADEEPAAAPAAPAEPAEPAAPAATPAKAQTMSPAATAATEAAMGAVEEATAEPEVDYSDEAVGLFKNTHGTEFDPNSKMDREKLDKMKGMLSKQGGLGEMSANQFALQVYRNS